MSSESGTIAAAGFTLQYRIEGAGPPATVIGELVFHDYIFDPEGAADEAVVWMCSEAASFSRTLNHPEDGSRVKSL